MLTIETLIHVFSLAVVSIPAALVAVLGLTSIVSTPLSERVTHRLVGSGIALGLSAAVGLFLLLLASGQSHMHLTVSLGHWIEVPHFHFSIKFLFDYLSMPFLILSYVLCGTISAFATRYLHREPGFNRFFVLLTVFVLGMVLTSLAGTIETMFAGWELVGLSSALLVAFFQERPAPVRNGLRVWTVYRVSDAALLLAAVALHHLRGEGDFDAVFGSGAWPNGVTALTSHQALIVGSLLLVAAAGKSALIPFSGWLPRAMEGPTPSSAVFYGALSVHLGAFLLLRAEPLLNVSPLLSGAVIVLGLSTAALAALTSRAQTDIKSALSFASLTQVGLIVAEIGIGFRWIALAHLLGHACLRTLQFLRAPTLLADYRTLENAIGSRLSVKPGLLTLVIPESVRRWSYRFALERGYLDAFLSYYIARPVLAFFRTCDRAERRWTDWLSGRASRESDRVLPMDLVEET